MALTDRDSRIAAKQMQDRDEFISSLRESFAGQVPGQNRGHELREFSESRWGGAISRSDGLAITRYLRNPTRFLVMSGPTGTGKSSAAFAVADYLIAATGRHARFAPATRMLSEFSFGRGDASGADLLKEYSEVPILVIDDIGSANDGMSGHQERSLWSLIDERWSHGLYTIITTNMAVSGNRDGDGIADLLGESAWDRICDSVTMVNFSGESFRGRK